MINTLASGRFISRSYKRKSLFARVWDFVMHGDSAKFYVPKK